MPTVINDLIVEPKASPPQDNAAGGGAAGDSGTPPGPEMERKVQRIDRTRCERSLRLWAH